MANILYKYCLAMLIIYNILLSSVLYIFFYFEPKVNTSKPHVQVLKDEGIQLTKGLIKNTSFISSDVKALVVRRKQILLFASLRSGSSFTGGLFASNPNIFYTFEPLGLYVNLNRKKIGLTSCINATLAYCLDNLFTCNLNTFIDEAAELSPHRRYWIKNVLSQVAHDNNITKRNIKTVPGIYWDVLCSNRTRYKAIATTIIRGHFIAHLMPLLRKGVQVLYLVRDPRQLVRSQYSIRKKRTLSYYLRKVVWECKRHKENIKFIQNLQKTNSDDLKYIKNNFRFIRYEDLALNLSYYAIKIYKFIGLQMTNEVNMYINAKAKVWKVIKRSHSKIDSGPELNKRYGENDTKPLKEYLSYKHVSHIQKRCAYMMKMFNYNVMKNKEEFENVSFRSTDFSHHTINNMYRL